MHGKMQTFISQIDFLDFIIKWNEEKVANLGAYIVKILSKCQNQY